MCYHDNCLYAGHQKGDLAIYKRGQGKLNISMLRMMMMMMTMAALVIVLVKYKIVFNNNNNNNVALIEQSFLDDI